MSPELLRNLSLAWMGLAALAFVTLLAIAAPYGRHERPGWGPTLPQRHAWVLMELVSPAALWAGWLFAGPGEGAAARVLVALWTMHYANRAIVYPLRAGWSERRMPLPVMGSAVVFNAVNGGLNGWALAASAPSSGWLFAAGAALFLAGAAANVDSDERLFRIRSGKRKRYAIPVGGLFRWVSCPNYLGEMVEWLGFALMAWNPAALSFFVWTVANLLPRARSHHRWYRERFDDYPQRRKAVFPGIV